MTKRMRKKFDLLVVGELNADLILTGDVLPEFNQVEKIVSDSTLTLGSSSAIFACGAARLGLKVVFSGKVGGDLFGQYILDQLSSHQIDTTAIKIDKGIKTGITVILNRAHDRAILTYPGSISKLSIADIDYQLVAKCKHLHLGGYYLLDDLRPDIPQLFRQAHDAGLTTSLDTNFDPAEKWGDEIWKVLKITDVFLPNQTELLAITRAAALDAAIEKVSRSVPTVAVKLGEKGAIAFHHNSKLTAEALKIPVVDTVGAGDSFDAGFVYGFLNNWELEKTLRFACICGSLSTRKTGGTDGQPTLEEALHWM